MGVRGVPEDAASAVIGIGTGTEEGSRFVRFCAGDEG